MKMFLVSGVPVSMQQDGWWMSPQAASPTSSHAGKALGKPDLSSVRLAILVALVALADALIWQVKPGVSLVVFFLAVLAAAMLFLRSYTDPGKMGRCFLIGLVAVIPLIEQIQVLSVLIAITGISLAAVVGSIGVNNLMTGLARLWLMMPIQAIEDVKETVSRGAKRADVSATARRLVLHWTLPAAFGLAFIGLLTEANPMLENWLSDLLTIELAGPEGARVFFWLVAALLIWPFLVLSRLRQRLQLPFTPLAGRQIRRPSLLNPAAVGRSLILFNGLFAVQSTMDVAYLWAGAVLPDGMSYAQYAHRGAYPLVATALLAGLFALLSRPFTQKDTRLRLALLLFVAQNVFLVCSSLFRLDLYVDAYGLTRLRMAAFVWMGLVAAGLCLIAWQILRQHRSGWLMRRLTGLGAAVLYTCMFVSFDATIARYNLTHDVPLDRSYLCGLGPAALPAMKTYFVETREPLCYTDLHPLPPHHKDWREWGFREWRVLRSLSAAQARIFAP